MSLIGIMGHVAHEAVDLTSSHVLEAFQPGQKASRPMIARDVRIGYRLRTCFGVVEVLDIQIETVTTVVIELELEDPSGTFFIGPADASTHAFIEVHGALAPLRDSDTVKIMSWKRHNQFRQVLLESAELESCRKALERAGYAPDLDSYGLGPGKMFVRVDQARAVLFALWHRCRSRPLRKSDVIVSSEFELTVQAMVRACAPRGQAEPHVEVLDISQLRAFCSDLGFIAEDRDVDGWSVASSTDGHISRMANPRLRALLAER
jgi:hypothetical protein